MHLVRFEIDLWLAPDNAQDAEIRVTCLINCVENQILVINLLL